MKWDGFERRKPSSDHDLLTRIDERMDSFLTTIAELKKKVQWHDKIIYMGLGGLAILQLILKVRG